MADDRNGPTDAPPRPAPPMDHGAMYRSDAIPGTGGVLKQREEDFLVDELPLYPPNGQGEHFMMLVEKRGLSTLQLVSILARHFDIPRNAVGYAGLKDRHAITRQHITVHVPGRRIEDFPSLQHDRVQILWIDRHDRKLRRGHLEGNGFSIRVRGVSMQAALQAHRTLEILEAKGMPNGFGQQRFGQWGTNHRIGRALVLGRAEEACDLLLGPTPAAAGDPSREAYAAGDLKGAFEALPRSAEAERRVLCALLHGKRPNQAIARLGKTETTFMVSALQGAILNDVLHERMRRGMLDTLVEGDIAVVHGARRTTFMVSAEEAASPETAERLSRLEVSPTGPLWGPKMRLAGGEIARMERAALEAHGLTPESIEQFAKKHRGGIDGDRRPLRVPLRYPQVEGGADEHGTYVRCGFELPRGSFATEAMAEVMKPDRAPVA